MLDFWEKASVLEASSNPKFSSLRTLYPLGTSVLIPNKLLKRLFLEPIPPNIKILKMVTKPIIKTTKIRIFFPRLRLTTRSLFSNHNPMATPTYWYNHIKKRK